MSWTNIRPYFTNILNDLDHTEHGDGFSFENIPSNIMDRAFHVAFGPINGDQQNQADQESTFTVQVRCFYKGYRYPQEAIDIGIAEAEKILKQCVSVANRTTTPGILNVLYDSSEIDPIGETNDNAVVVTSTYSVRVIIDV